MDIVSRMGVRNDLKLAADGRPEWPWGGYADTIHSGKMFFWFYRKVNSYSFPGLPPQVGSYVLLTRVNTYGFAKIVSLDEWDQCRP